MIKVTGVDATEDEMQKALGKKWKLVVVDEGQSYSVDLRTLLYGILGPALIDQDGDAWLMGTAGNLTQGLFYDVTNGAEKGWNLFQWTAHDNPYVAKQWKKELAKIDRERPEFKETSLYKQWYLNQWVIDEDARVYKYQGSRNDVDGLPVDITDWHYVLGLDLAHSPDSSSFSVGCYAEDHPNLYFVRAQKFLGMDITDVAIHVKKLETLFKFDVKVVDGANKQAVAELNNRHGLNLLPADKREKADFIKLMNDDWVQGNIKMLPATQAYKDELRKLIWVTDAKGKIMEPRKEYPVIHYDLADGSLYLWRHSYQYVKRAIPGEKTIDFNRQSSWEPAHIEKLSEQVKKDSNPNELSLDWDQNFDMQDSDLI